MKSAFSLILVFGLVFHPAFLRAAEATDASAQKAADAAVAAEDSAKGSADLDAGADAGDWELGKDDLAAEDEDLKMDEEEGLKKDAASVPAVNGAAVSEGGSAKPV